MSVINDTCTHSSTVWGNINEGLMPLAPSTQFYTTYPAISNIFYFVAGIQWVLGGELTIAIFYFLVTGMSTTYHICFIFDQCRRWEIGYVFRLLDHILANNALLASELAFTDLSRSKNWSIIVPTVLSFSAVAVVLLERFSSNVFLLLQVVFAAIIFIRYIIMVTEDDLKLVYLTLFRKKTLVIAMLTGAVGIFFFFSDIVDAPVAVYNNIGHSHWHVYSATAGSLLALARRIKTSELWVKFKKTPL